MKKKQTIHVQEDEAFLEGINLVTGLKINYDRPVLTEHQLNALCIDEKYSKIQKAIKILKSGQALQKWSLFQNLAFYLTTPQQYEQILHLIQKYFEDLQPMLDMIAVGLTSCISYMIQTFEQDIQVQNNKKPFYLSQKGQKTLFRLCMRSFTDEKYNKVALQDWSVLFDEFFIYLEIAKSPRMNDMIEQCLQYIAGSFSMNTAPQRRRIAFEMIKGLVEHSQKVKERAKTKASFFNNDTNSKTRIVICQAMGKLLNLQPDDQQIRKFLIDYFHDNEFSVRQKSFYYLLNIPNQKHLDAILNAVQQEQDQISNLVLENLQNFINNFHPFIKPNKRYRTIISNMINSVLKSEDAQKISKVFPSLNNLYNLIFLNNKEKQNFFDVFIFDHLDFQNQLIFKALLLLYKEIQSCENNRDAQRVLEFYVQKNLKSAKNKQNFSKNITNLKLYLSFFTYQSEQENNTYIGFLMKMVQQSKWAQAQFLLEELKRISITEALFQKISISLIRLIMYGPYFLIEQICKAILYLLLSKRKHLEFFLSIKEKLTSSKTWLHRRNYIILYAEVKAGSSYEFHKIIPPLNYKLITKQKCNGVKLQFLKYAAIIYQSIDPTTTIQKIALKDAVSELCNQKDEDICQLAREVIKKLGQSEIDFYRIQKINQRNNTFLLQEQKMRQKQALLLKKTKTERQLGRKDSKSKTLAGQSRSSLRIPKDITRQLKKQITIVNVQKLRRPSTVTGNFRNLPKPEEQKKAPTMTGSSSNSSMSSSSSSTMTRIFSGQMRGPNKLPTMKRQSGFKR